MLKASMSAPWGVCLLGAWAASWLLGVETRAATIWTGPKTTFTKMGGADPTDPANQDRITDNVWITRGATRGPYNIRTESAFVDTVSPADTEWAVGTTADIGSLAFFDFQGLILGTFGSGNIQNAVGQDLVLHLISEDIYIDLKITEWGGAASGGSFAWERSTAVPEPAAGLLAGAALLAVALRRRGSR